MVVLKFLERSSKLKKLLLLNEIAKDPDKSQNKLADILDVSPSMVNNYIKEFVENDWLEKDVKSSRNMSYYLTKEGESYKNKNYFSYMVELIKLYEKTKEDIQNNLKKLLLDQGINKVVCYGAGKAADVVLLAIKEMNLEILGIVDDDKCKIGDYFHEYKIKNPDEIDKLYPDTIIISTVEYSDIIYNKIKHYEDNGINIIKI